MRVDVLRKTGMRIEIIEVKAKSYSAKKDGDFRGAKGQLKSDFLPYLQDVAFQRYVAEEALPRHQVHAFLMLVDKEQSSTVARRASIESALLRYCELDTLAMVMAIQAWDHMAAAATA